MIDFWQFHFVSDPILHLGLYIISRLLFVTFSYFFSLSLPTPLSYLALSLSIYLGLYLFLSISLYFSTVSLSCLQLRKILWKTQMSRPLYLTILNQFWQSNLTTKNWWGKQTTWILEQELKQKYNSLNNNIIRAYSFLFFFCRSWKTKLWSFAPNTFYRNLWEKWKACIMWPCEIIIRTERHFCLDCVGLNQISLNIDHAYSRRSILYFNSLDYLRLNDNKPRPTILRCKSAVKVVCANASFFIYKRGGLHN